MSVLAINITYSGPPDHGTQGVLEGRGSPEPRGGGYSGTSNEVGDRR